MRRKGRKKRKIKIPRARAHPEQAGLVRRGLALTVDLVIITLISLLIYAPASELVGLITGEPGIITKTIDSLRVGRSVTMSLWGGEDDTEDRKPVYLAVLRDIITREEHERAEEMTAEEIEEEFRSELEEAEGYHTEIETGEGFELFQEFIVGYIYFVLFFRFGGRTLGKRLFGLKAIDLEEKKRLGWYQSFERTHGYAASALFLSLGYWQVLWDKKGLAMHDKIAETTVVRVRKGKKRKSIYNK
ncbi:MAG: RDD family protein [bacterium]|nr:RDD family protein [bacterium]